MTEQTSTSNLAEFSDRFSPVFVKELRQGLRAHQFVWPFMVIQVFSIAAVALEHSLGQFGASSGMFVSLGLGGGLFFGALSIVFCIIMPMTLFGALQPEIQDGNVELLLMSNLSRWQVMLGKLLVATVLALLTLVSLIPYMLIRYFVGDVELVATASGVLWLIIGNIQGSAIVLGASGVRNIIGRLFLIVYIFISFSVMAAVGAGFGSRIGGGFVIMSSIGTSIIGVALCLQLGRAKLRIYENPLDPPATALIMILFVVCPIFVGIISAMFAEAFGSSSSGFLPSLGFLIILLLGAFGISQIDRGPGKKNPMRWAQP